MTMERGGKQAKTLVGLRSLVRARFRRTARKPAERGLRSPIENLCDLVPSLHE